MGEDVGNVTKLPVRFKNPLPDERTLMMPHEVPHEVQTCSHLFVQYIVDPALAEVECGQCGAKLNPMWVLNRLAAEDRRYHEGMKRYHEEMRRLSEREKTKCFNCGHMTRISRR